MKVKVGDVVLPGDIVEDIPEDVKTKVILGPGLRLSSDEVYAQTSGILRKKEKNTFWVDSHQKRYVPSRGENVVGVVVNKAGDIFKVDIGSSEQASLSCFAFEGATKKYRPHVVVGDLVYAKLLMANRDMEPELVCVDSFGKKLKLGILPPEGFLFTCSLNLIRKILNPKCKLLSILGKQVAHESAIGMNGKIWIKANTVQETIGIANAILCAEYKTYDEINSLSKNVLNQLAGL